MEETIEKKEKNLENFLFGSEIKSKVKSISNVQDLGSSDESESSIPEEENDIQNNKKKAKKAKYQPLWEDDDDEAVLVKDVAKTYQKAKGKHGSKEISEEKYSSFLKRKYVSFVGTPKWAKLDENKAENEDSDDEFFRENTDMLRSGKQQSLEKGFLEHRKLKDLNFESHAEGTIIKAAEFHPKATVALVAGLNGTVSLFQVDGKLNPKIQTVNFENFPINTAHFASDGQEILVGSQNHDHFFIYDMVKGRTNKIRMGKKLEQRSLQGFVVSPVNDYIAVLGKFGHIHLLNASNKDFSFSFKMNDSVKALAFSADGQNIYSHGGGGEVYIWDVRSTRSCVHKFIDDGSVQGSSIAISPDNRYLACGSNSGVVNLYNRQKVLESVSPKPEKIVLNLTTTVNHLKFNPTSEILAMASESKENAIKLMHVPSQTVFRNFPSFKFNLKRVNCFDFSLNGGYFSVGNNGGAANLYRLKYYGNY